MYIILVILVIGILIASHELGHFTAAKLCGVKVNEYSIGMGPALWKKQKGETLYALRVLPIGGYCAMEGEDDDTGDPRSFTAQALWKKIVILVAGAFVNFVLGVIIILILYSGAQSFVTSEITSVTDGFQYGGENGLMVGDEIYSIDGRRIFYVNDFSTYMSRSFDGKVDMVIIRNGEKITLKDYALSTAEFKNDDGTTSNRYGLSFKVIKAGVVERIKYSLYTAYNFLRLIEMSFADLISGAVGINQLTGIVGIVDTLNDVGTSSPSVKDGILNVLYLCSFIAISLAVTNLLPIPALDGGRIFLLLVTWIIEKITRRRVNPKYEGYINAVGMVCLISLTVVILYFDITRIIRG